MLTDLAATRRRSRQPRPNRLHGSHLVDTPVPEPPDWRAHLEQVGWRTRLEYHENILRGDDGCLIEAQPWWCAEAEWRGGPVWYASAYAATPEQAWLGLIDEVERLVSTAHGRSAVS